MNLEFFQPMILQHKIYKQPLDLSIPDDTVMVTVLLGDKFGSV